jgi:hypothetical protein
MSLSIHIPKASTNLTEDHFKQMFQNFLRCDCVEQVDFVLMKYKEELYNMVFVHFYPNIPEVELFYNQVKSMERKYMLNGLNIQPNFKPKKQSRHIWTEEEKLEIEEFFRLKDAGLINNKINKN